MKRYRTRRNLLLARHLDAFLSWALANGYISHPRPARADYEVARISKYDPAGDNPHVVIYRRIDAQHLTVEGEGVELVLKWLAERARKGDPCLTI